MKCPFCGDPSTQVTDTRENEAGDTVRRRRRCTGCDRRFTTYERVDLKFPYIVKRDGSRVEYDRNKLMGSLKLALRKRPVTTAAVEAAVDHIEEQLRSRGEREVSSGRIGELVMQALRGLDKVAYVRFASVYLNFDDVEQFTRAIREVRRPRARAESKS